MMHKHRWDVSVQHKRNWMCVSAGRRTRYLGMPHRSGCASACPGRPSRTGERSCVNLLACAIQTWLPVVGSGKVSPRVEATRPIWIKASESATIPKAGSFGTWRSLVAHLTGGQGVAGSNPVVPTVVVSKSSSTDAPRHRRSRFRDSAIIDAGK